MSLLILNLLPGNTVQMEPASRFQGEGSSAIQEGRKNHGSDSPTQGQGVNAALDLGRNFDLSSNAIDDLYFMPRTFRNGPVAPVKASTSFAVVCQTRLVCYSGKMPSQLTAPLKQGIKTPLLVRNWQIWVISRFLLVTSISAGDNIKFTNQVILVNQTGPDGATDFPRFYFRVSSCSKPTSQSHDAHIFLSCNQELFFLPTRFSASVITPQTQIKTSLLPRVSTSEPHMRIVMLSSL